MLMATLRTRFTRCWAGAQILSAVLPSLAPGQTVYYTVGDDGYGVYSAEYSFVAPPAANSTGTTTVRPRRMWHGGTWAVWFGGCSERCHT